MKLPSREAKGTVSLGAAKHTSRLTTLTELLKLPLTIIFYIYGCRRKDLHLLSHFGEVNT